MEHLHEIISEYSDEKIMDQILNHAEEYTEEAMKLLYAEADSRKIDLAKEIKTDNERLNYQIRHLESKDFEPFNHVFTQTDIELAGTILRENEILFYIDNSNSSSILPIESIASKTFSMHVHKEGFEKAEELLGEHFEKMDGFYRLKNNGIRDRLIQLSFAELHMSELEAQETVEVDFTEQEKDCIREYGMKILKEIDRIELEQDRFVFYYDSIEPLLGHLTKKQNLHLTKTELVTILEILQIFCRDDGFPEYIDASIETLLGFFLS